MLTRWLSFSSQSKQGPFAGRFDHTTEEPRLGRYFRRRPANLELVAQITAINPSFIGLSLLHFITSEKKWKSFTFCVRRPLIWA